jgi:putative copper resistance protein D
VRSFEHDGLDAADMRVGRPRHPERGGQGDQREHPQHEPHSSEEPGRTQRPLSIRYTDRVYALGLAARWLHLASSVLLVGAAVMILIAGRSDRATAQRWERRVLACAWGFALVALAAGLVVLGSQTALFEGRAAAALETHAIGRVLVQTQAGHVWLVRAGFLALLVAFLSLRVSVERRADWRAARGEAVLLGVSALVPLAAAGHAAAVEPDTARAIALDALHVLAAGVWVGGLLPLALLLRAAATEEGADARPYAVLAARRFSRAALVILLVLVVTGSSLAITHVGNVAGLVGTSYGRLLLAKLTLLVLALSFAALNRSVLLARLGGDGPTVGRPAMRRLSAFVAVEAALALLILVIVAAMNVTPPARHEAPVWPFTIRLSFAALEGRAAEATRALIGSQIGMIGLVALITGLAVRAWRLPLAAVALAALGAGAGLALPPLTIDAYPTTYLRPSVPYQAGAITAGAALYQTSCAGCHGARGAGDGPDGRALPRPPADLRAPHTAQHTAGDLFWWISHGIPGSGMPGFGSRLTEDQRWELINFLRALSAGFGARGMGSTIERDRRWLVAPDFTFTVGPTPPRALKDYRGRNVLVVLYALPGSRPRMSQLAGREGTLAVLGVEVIAVPIDADPDAIRRLGDDPRVLFPVVTEGAETIVAAYRLFAVAPHVELLIDRQGYVRAITRSSGEAMDLDTLVAQVQQLNDEKTAGEAPPEEHVH